MQVAEAQELLSQVLAQQYNQHVELELRDTHARPGAGTTYSFVGTLAGSEELTHWYISSSKVPAPKPGDTHMQLKSNDGDNLVISIWRYPFDPILSDLPLVVQLERTAGLMRELEIPQGSGLHKLDIVVYRPLRRAVVRAVSDEVTSYFKVVRPKQVIDLVEKHRLGRSAGLPVPAILAYKPSGLIAMSEVQGRSMANDFLPDGGKISPEQVIALLDSLPEALTDFEMRPSWSSRLKFYERMLLDAGEEFAGVKLLCDQIRERISDEPGPVVATHGDFYEAQVLIQGGEITGLLDFDTAGPGYRVDDYACLLGHLSVLPSLAPQVYQDMSGHLNRWTAALAAEVDPDELFARSAAVVLSLAASALHAENQNLVWQRLQVAEVWLSDKMRKLSSFSLSDLI